jgi:2-C-methyl-D-erythritol 4-phosphate cytidylyltransferase
MPAPACHALVPCAGSGVRAGQGVPKQYVPVAGRAVVAHTLEALARVEALATILVVLAPDDARFEAEVEPSGVARGRIAVARCGGATRAESVANGLDALAARGAAEDDWVLVHDAARCLVRPEWIERLIAACRDDAVGGLLALPVADTLKQATPEGRVAATRDRTGAWQAQTPQMFRLGLLRAALARAGPAITDEAGAMEAAGRAPLLVPGDLENFKLTRPGDFALAERLLATRP